MGNKTAKLKENKEMQDTEEGIFGKVLANPLTALSVAEQKTVIAALVEKVNDLQKELKFMKEKVYIFWYFSSLN